MSVPFYDWLGRYKLVDFGGYTALVGPNADLIPTCEWWKQNTGRRPDIRNTYEVSQEFHDAFKSEYEAKGVYFDGSEGGEL